MLNHRIDLIGQLLMQPLHLSLPLLLHLLKLLLWVGIPLIGALLILMLFNTSRALVIDR